MWLFCFISRVYLIKFIFTLLFEIKKTLTLFEGWGFFKATSNTPKTHLHKIPFFRNSWRSISLWMDDDLKYFSKSVLINTLADLSAYHYNHATTYLNHYWKYSNSWDSLSWVSWNLHPDSRLKALQYSPQICTSFRGAIQIKCQWTRKHTIFMEEPSKRKLQMSRQAKQKKKKREMLEQPSIFFAQQPSTHRCSGRRYERHWTVTNRSSLPTWKLPGHSSCNWCKVVDQFSLYRLVLCVFYDFTHYQKKVV